MFKFQIHVLYTAAAWPIQKEHISRRFDELDQILTNDPKFVVRFPGTGPEYKYGHKHKHSLGMGKAGNDWGLFKCDKPSLEDSDNQPLAGTALDTEMFETDFGSLTRTRLERADPYNKYLVENSGVTDRSFEKNHPSILHEWISFHIFQLLEDHPDQVIFSPFIGDPNREGPTKPAGQTPFVERLHGPWRPYGPQFPSEPVLYRAQKARPDNTYDKEIKVEHFIIDVFGANAANVQLHPKSQYGQSPDEPAQLQPKLGGTQAASFHYLRPGVFGISTMRDDPKWPIKMEEVYSREEPLMEYYKDFNTATMRYSKDALTYLDEYHSSSFLSDCQELFFDRPTEEPTLPVHITDFQRETQGQDGGTIQFRVKIPLSDEREKKGKRISFKIGRVGEKLSERDAGSMLASAVKKLFAKAKQWSQTEFLFRGFELSSTKVQARVLPEQDGDEIYWDFEPQRGEAFKKTATIKCRFVEVTIDN